MTSCCLYSNENKVQNGIFIPYIDPLNSTYWTFKAEIPGGCWDVEGVSEKLDDLVQ